MPKRLSNNSKSPPSLERVLFLFSYDPDIGEIKRRIARGNGAVGSVVGATSKRDHVQIMVDGEVYEAHQIIWLMMTGAWPKFEIDHEDLNTKNNKWRNLREATHAQNMKNKPLYKSNIAGVKGVSFRAARKAKPYAARITILRKTTHLGYFGTAREAGEAYYKAAILHFGEFARAA